jgi:hypothetical protein
MKRGAGTSIDACAPQFVVELEGRRPSDITDNRKGASIEAPFLFPVRVGLLTCAEPTGSGARQGEAE